MAYQLAATAVILHRLQAFSNAIRRTFVQHFTRFQLTVCSYGSSALAELLVSCPVVVGGDINIHVHDARRLHKLLESFEMIQHVNVATYDRGATLDLVMTFAGCPLDDVSVDRLATMRSLS